MTGIVGAVFAFGFNFAPRGWALCNGQQLPISDFQALFALIGTTYGGNGQTTFAMPNLQGRVPIGFGQGPGLANYALGQAAGSETVTLTASNLPPHTHPVLSAKVPVSGSVPNSTLSDPNGNYLGVANGPIGNIYDSTSTSGVTMAASTGVTGATGNGIPITILNQYQVVSYCICTEGLFPQRN